MRKLFLIIFCFAAIPASVYNTYSKEGSCEYEKHPIRIKIISVKNLSPSSSSDQTTYEIRFVVLLTPELPKIIENRSFGRDYQMLLHNKTFPGPLFIKKYEISRGKIFDGYYHILVRGTCRPGFFEFPGIKLDDYFES